MNMNPSSERQNFKLIDSQLVRVKFLAEDDSMDIPEEKEYKYIKGYLYSILKNALVFELKRLSILLQTPRRFSKMQ